MTQLELILAGGLSQAASRASLGWSIGAISDYLALLYPDASRTAIAQVAYIANASVQAAREARGPEGVEGITPSDVPIRPGLEAGEWQTTVSVTIISPRTSRSERFVIRVGTTGQPTQTELDEAAAAFAAEQARAYGVESLPIALGPIVTEIYRGPNR